MNEIKLGIFGLWRGGSFIHIINSLEGAAVHAICDKNEAMVAEALKSCPDAKVCADFEELLDSGIDAVLLCNYFHQHAPLAIRFLEKNIHVLSECASNGTMAEGVALARAAKKSKAIYMLAENYPYMLFNQEMKKVYEEGSLGKILFAEGEYNHPLDPKDEKTIASLRPFEKHWRNYLPRTYYVTHSLAPLMFITGSKPVRVTAMPVFSPQTEEGLFSPRVGDKAAIITCLNDDHSVYRVTGCAAFGNEENSYR
jgi:predicted dehydrogenase